MSEVLRGNKILLPKARERSSSLVGHLPKHHISFRGQGGSLSKEALTPDMIFELVVLDKDDKNR